ncbi:hypothetical protein ACS0TY_030357 [Phlomoides rotata]
MVPGKSAKECFERIHSDQSTPSQPPARSRPKRKEPSPILFSPTKLLSPAEMNRKKRISRMRSTLAAQKTVRKLLQKQHTEDQDYEADLFSVLEPTIDPPPLNLQDGTPFSSPAPNQGSSSAQRKQRSRLSNSQKAAFVSPPVLKQIKNKVLHENYIDQLHCRDAKRKAAASRKAKKVYANNTELVLRIGDQGSGIASLDGRCENEENVKGACVFCYIYEWGQNRKIDADPETSFIEGQA